MADNIQHEDIPADKTHVAFRWQVPTVADLSTITDLTPEDVYKEALIVTTNEKYILKSSDPVTWESISGTGGGATSLGALTDVTITNPLDKQVLIYDTVTGGWINDTIAGGTGIDGQSAYEIAVENGFVGTEAQWLVSLKGDKGDTGEQGIQGIQGIKGDKGDTGEGVPVGGTTGQILAKTSNTDFDTEWIPQPSVTVTYSTSAPVPTTIGGIEAGKTYTDANITTVIDDLLFPYQTPTFSAFASNMPTSLEVGDTIAAGSKNFTWSTTNASNINANSIVIKQGSTAISSGLANDGAESILVSNITYSTATTLGFIIEATNTKGAILTRSFNIQWRNAVYYGESALTTLAENDIEALRVKTLASTVTASYAMLAGGYKWICYPTALGLKTTFKDTSTNLNVAMNPVETVIVTNAFGVTQNYYAHRTLNVLGGSITIGVS